jgi:hypothetical protein
MKRILTGACVVLCVVLCACGDPHPSGDDAAATADAAADAPTAVDAAGDDLLLTVTAEGDGTGVVTSQPAGVDCGTNCEEAYASGTVVTLNQTANAGSVFTGWSGACTGTGPCAVTMDQPRAVTATFVIPPNYMFVTSTMTNALAMGGLAGADAICQSHADAAGLPGTYRAWLSTDTVNANTRLGNASGWIRPDGKPFAATVADLTNNKLFHPPRIDEAAIDVYSSVAFTGTRHGVFGGVDPDNDCLDWTGDAMFVSVEIGTTAQNGEEWTDYSDGTCALARRLYCFGTDHEAVVAPATPAGPIRRAFMTAWQVGGGLASADDACASAAESAGLPGSYRALLATIGESPIARFDETGPPWYRVDDVAILAPSDVWSTATFLEASPNLTADGQTPISGILWTGAATAITAGTAASTCDDWTDPSAQAGRGSAGWTDLVGFFSYYPTACDHLTGAITCLQE